MGRSERPSRLKGIETRAPAVIANAHITGCVKLLHTICQNRGLRGERGRGFLCISSLLSQDGVDFSKIPYASI